MRNMLRGKIHRATVTGADLHYEGSVTIDLDLLERADIIPYQQVDIWNVTKRRALPNLRLGWATRLGGGVHQRRRRAQSERRRPGYHRQFRPDDRKRGTRVGPALCVRGQAQPPRRNPIRIRWAS